jgi:hypothetical protein
MSSGCRSLSFEPVVPFGDLLLFHEGQCRLTHALRVAHVHVHPIQDLLVVDYLILVHCFASFDHFCLATFRR